MKHRTSSIPPSQTEWADRHRAIAEVIPFAFVIVAVVLVLAAGGFFR